MRTIYHFLLCPFSRKVRILLSEKSLKYKLVTENFWERREEFAHFNPAMQVPVLVEENNYIIADSNAICEYLEEKYPERIFLGHSLAQRAEIRRLVSWFDIKFFNEVTKYMLYEKVVRYYTNIGEPNSEAIRSAAFNLENHLNYIEYLTEGYKCLAGDNLSLADITAASHISVIDFLGQMKWTRYPKVKEWYVKIKSRPSFRPLLNDKLIGYFPPDYYSDLDF